jgi:hypothetical protein
MASKLPEGCIEPLDFMHDPYAPQRTPEKRKALCVALGYSPSEHERICAMWKSHAESTPPHPCNLVLLPDLATACDVFRSANSGSAYHGHSYDPQNVIDHVTGQKCHVSPDLLNRITSLADRLADAVRELQPTLCATPKHYRAEMGDIWDAGLIAEGDERPCFAPRYDGPEPSKGQGNGAYRILINTDTSFGRSDSENLATTLCLCNVLAHFGPVEIWVQQGWLNTNNTDPASRSSGIVCFRVGELGSINPSALAFWLGSPYRDSVFSYVISRKIGRTNSGCSQSPAVPCDWFSSNATGAKQPSANQALADPTSPEGKTEINNLAAYLVTVCEGIIYPADTLTV